MQKSKLRLSALLLALILTFSSLVSCSEQNALMTYKDSSITSNMYSYWLSTYKANFLKYYNNSLDSDEFWDSTVSEGQNAEQYVTDWINDYVKTILVGVQLFNEYGLKLSSSTVSDIDSDIAEKTDFYGGRAALNSALSAYGINDNILRDCYIAEEKLEEVREYLYGENGTEAVTEEMIDKYYTDNYSRVKFLVIYTTEKFAVDENGEYVVDEEGYLITEELNDDEKAAKRAIIDEALLDLRAGESFDTINAKYNENYANMEYYKNGFYISANEYTTYGFKMVSEVGKMKVGETRVIEDEYACYIVQKLDLLPRSEFEAPDKELTDMLEEYCIQEKFAQKFSALADEVTVNEDELALYSVRTASANNMF